MASLVQSRVLVVVMVVVVVGDSRGKEGCRSEWKYAAGWSAMNIRWLEEMKADSVGMLRLQYSSVLCPVAATLLSLAWRVGGCRRFHMMF